MAIGLKTLTAGLESFAGGMGLNLSKKELRGIAKQFRGGSAMPTTQEMESALSGFTEKSVAKASTQPAAKEMAKIGTEDIPMKGISIGEANGRPGFSNIFDEVEMERNQARVTNKVFGKNPNAEWHGGMESRSAEIKKRVEQNAKIRQYEKRKAEYAGVSHDTYKQALKDNPSMANLSADELKAHFKDAGAGPSKSLDSLMFRKKAGAGKGEQYMVDATNKQLAADLNAMSDPLARKDIGNTYGIKDHEKMTTTQFKNAVRDHHAQRVNAGPKAMDHMMGHKVPQKAAGLLVTAGVVSSLSGSKGQQSNAQLYGQAPMPGM